MASASPAYIDRPEIDADLFEAWTGNRELRSLGTNAGADPLAFQGWHRFKEAFPPELIRLAVARHNGVVRSCLDPFGGSGTMALAAQFLGIASTTIEVDPFLADSIRAKVAAYNADDLARSYAAVSSEATCDAPDPTDFFADVPGTFIEPGVDNRWLFNAQVAAQLASLLRAIDDLPEASHQRLLRVLVGGILLDVSNAVVNGKGRRYRRRWRERRVSAAAVTNAFRARATAAIADIHRFAGRPPVPADVIVADARTTIPRREFDLAVFSPPYPNSFDYTDVYNIELWMLGYLRGSDDNRRLRSSTLSSHVQLRRDYAVPPVGSRTLDRTLAALEAIRANLWSPWIPGMVGAYFQDVCAVLGRVRTRLRPGGACWLVVGDSRYGGVFVPTGRILAELAEQGGWRVSQAEPFRSMRSSAQHGGKNELAETLLVLHKGGSLNAQP